MTRRVNSFFTASFIRLPHPTPLEPRGLLLLSRTTKVSKSALLRWGPKEQKITAKLLFIPELRTKGKWLPCFCINFHRWFLDFYSVLRGGCSPISLLQGNLSGVWPLLYPFYTSAFCTSYCSRLLSTRSRSRSLMLFLVCAGWVWCKWYEL